MPQLQFAFQEIIAEIKAFSKVARDYIAPESLNVLPQLWTNLEVIQQLPDGTLTNWGITQAYPLRTIASEGQYEHNGGGQHHLFAEMTSIWEIVPRGHRRRPGRNFALVGNASTRVRLIDATSSVSLAMWRMEIGDAASPGCHFHVQVLGEEPDGPFPNTLPIPRFPGILVTPMVALEFVLAELFQDEWKKHAARETADMNMWRPIQTNRLSRLLEWKCYEAKRFAGSPWTALKWAKPQADLFTE
jgi:hypothetical protein